MKIFSFESRLVKLNSNLHFLYLQNVIKPILFSPYDMETNKNNFPQKIRPRKQFNAPVTLTSSFPQTVSPDLANFWHFGKILKGLISIFKLLTNFGKCHMLLGKFSVLHTAKYWKSNLGSGSGHTALKIKSHKFWKILSLKWCAIVRRSEASFCHFRAALKSVLF